MKATTENELLVSGSVHPKDPPAVATLTDDHRFIMPPMAGEELAVFRGPRQQLLGAAIRCLVLSAVAAGILWPIVDRQINYQFKSLPQYLHQEWVWWVKTTR